MNVHNTRRLMARYPRLFGLAKLGPRSSAMCFGFECGDGWHDIIDKTSWWMTALWKLFRVEVVATQVKEKFGSLRFYHVTTCPSWMPAFIAAQFAELCWWLEYKAGEESEHTCERCGRPGKIGDAGYWVSTSCKECAPKGWKAHEAVAPIQI